MGDNIIKDFDSASFADASKKCSENAKRRTIVGPWRNVAEFNKVYDWIFGEECSADSRRQALKQIQIWSLRRSTLCPAAVLATSVILDVQQKDDASNEFSAEALQILYSNAFTRFFNFMSSIMQSHNLRSMYQTAKELGLQSFVVDLRHICAHGQVLPPLDMLRNTAEYCVLWLHDYYWASQRNTMCDVDAAHIRRSDKNEFDVKVSELFEIYDSALEGYIKGATNLKTLKRHLHGKRFNCVKEFYMQNELPSLQAAFNGIVLQLCDLVKRGVAIKDMAEIYVEAFLKMKFFFTAHQSHSSDNNLLSLISVTQTLFRMLSIFDFVEDLFLALIEISENPIADVKKRAGASFWAVKMAEGFQAFRQCKKMYKTEVDANSIIREPPFINTDLTQISEGTKDFLIYSGVDMRRTIIFGDHFRRPWVWEFNRDFIEDRLENINEYTVPILKSLFPLVTPEISKSLMEVFIELTDCIYECNSEKAYELPQESLSDETHVEIKKIHTDIDFLTKINKNNSDNEMLVDDVNSETEKMKFGIWAQIPDNEALDWKSSALGRLPWE